jgi:hypothetical protein
MTQVQCPCKDCKDRKVGCHAKCEKYIKYAEYSKWKAEKRTEFWKGRYSSARVQ